MTEVEAQQTREQPATVVVGVGLSVESAYVLAKTVRLVGDADRILAVHVLEDPYADAPFEGETTIVDGALIEQVETAARSRLHELCERSGVKRAALVHGHPATALHRMALEYAAELIVVGTHGRQGWRAILGNTATTVLRDAPCGVLAILASPELADGGSHDYGGVLAAVDLSDEADEVVAAAARVATRFGAALYLVTVVRSLSTVYAGIDLSNLLTARTALHQAAEEQAEAKLKVLAEKHGAKRWFVRHGEPPGEIRATAQQVAADLMVVGSHGTHGPALFFGSTPDALLHRVTCDVLAVRVGLPTEGEAALDRELKMLHSQWAALHEEQAELMHAMVQQMGGLVDHGPLWARYQQVLEQQSEMLTRIHALKSGA